MDEERIDQEYKNLGRWLQAVWYRDEVKFPGLWNPRLILDVLKSGLEAHKWQGKRVLDIGACNGGLSIEIARLGASVRAVEPNPQARAQFEYAFSRLPDRSNLDISFEDGTLFSLDPSEEYDVVLFLGLVYHFRYPQMVLDHLASFNAKTFFISSQTHRSDRLVMINRREQVAHYGHRILAGYHPSRPLLKRMIEWAGFSEVSEIITQDTGRDFEDRNERITNSAYFVAKKGVSFDIDLIKNLYM